MVWGSTPDVLVRKAPLPLYVAVMEWAPGVRVAVVNFAFPETTALVPNTAAPFLNVTVPVALLGDTVAVNTTGCPKTDGFAEAARVVVVGCRTACIRLALLAVKLPLPL